MLLNLISICDESGDFSFVFFVLDKKPFFVINEVTKKKIRNLFLF